MRPLTRLGMGQSPTKPSKTEAGMDPSLIVEKEGADQKVRIPVHRNEYVDAKEFQKIPPKGLR